MLNCWFGTPELYIQRQSNKFKSGLALWEQYTDGTVEFGKFVFMKFYMSFWFANVNVGFVCKVMKTLLILVFGDPINVKPWVTFPLLFELLLLLEDPVQTEGWPVQLNPDYTWQVFEHPSPDLEFPSSQVSPF